MVPINPRGRGKKTNKGPQLFLENGGFVENMTC